MSADELNGILRDASGRESEIAVPADELKWNLDCSFEREFTQPKRHRLSLSGSETRSLWDGAVLESAPMLNLARLCQAGDTKVMTFN